jgi:hypothetical protein
MSKALTLLALAAWVAAAVPAQAEISSSKKPTRDPNQRVCEDIVATGSRLATKRICATRAQWEEKRKQDREVVDDAQRHAAGPCNVVNTHSGTPSC